MNVKELKELINSLPTNLDDCEVVMSKDDEGNGYNVLYSVDSEDNLYNAEDEEVVSQKYYECTNDEWEEYKDDNTNLLRCIVLW